MARFVRPPFPSPTYTSSPLSLLMSTQRSSSKLRQCPPLLDAALGLPRWRSADPKHAIDIWGQPDSALLECATGA